MKHRVMASERVLRWLDTAATTPKVVVTIIWK